MIIAADYKQNEILLRSTKELTTRPNFLMFLRNLIGVPEKIIKYYEADKSGNLPKPTAGSNIKAEERIWFYHHATHKYLTGDALSIMTERLVESLQRRLAQFDIGDEWLGLTDFWLFFRSLMFEASVEAVFGKYLLELTPSIKEDFWKVDQRSAQLIQGFPRWLIPDAYAARMRVTDGIKRWHKFANKNSNGLKLSPDDPEWDPHWGARIIRARRQHMSAMHFMDDDAKAAEDLAFLFASHANPIPAAGWMAFQTFFDPCLLERARKDVAESHEQTDGPTESRKLSIAKLCAKPLIQSMYAETLRLTSGIAVGRTPQDQPFRLGEWTVPQGQMVLVCNRTTNMNNDLWNTGSSQDPHPVDSFWADRFIIYPDNPTSGPLKHPLPGNEKVQDAEFSTRGLSGAWSPYGGGANMCPGRAFAKNEIIVGMAVLVASYDIEFQVPEGFKPHVNMDYFPVSLVPFRATTRSMC